MLHHVKMRRGRSISESRIGARRPMQPFRLFGGGGSVFNTIEYLSKQSKSSLLALGFIIVGVMGLFDYIIPNPG